ncbi:MAG: MarR family winged helix-turn-helix transcriptional regulator [Pararhodobacter sp.]
MIKNDNSVGTTGIAELTTAFAVFTETGIIAQLTSTLLERKLPKGMVTAQFGVLNHLSSRPSGETPLQLARAFQVPKTSMTHSLAVLEREALVETVPNPEDGRSKIVCITPAGLRFRAGLIEALAPDVVQTLAPLTPGTLEQLLPLLRDLRRVMDDARNG